MTESDVGTAASWSYGLAAITYAAFAIRLALGWRGGPRATLLIVAMVVTSLWAASVVLFAQWSTPTAWLAANGLDALRYGALFVFLASLLQGAEATGARSPSLRIPVAPWTLALVVAALAASVLISDGSPFGQLLGPKTRSAEYVLRLGLAIFGLILVEQLLRRALPHARWGLKPLCVGLAGVFAFDIFFYAQAMLFSQLDSNIFVARGAANALVIPLIAMATARNTGWTLELHMSREVVFQTTALLVSGAFLIAVALAGYFVRFLGGGWGQALQIELLFAALLIGLLVASSGRFRSKLRVFVSKNFFSYRYDYRKEWLRFTRTLAEESSVPRVPERCIEALANLVESPAGALWLKREDSGFLPASRWNMPVIAADAVEPADGSMARFMQRSGWIINLREHASDSAHYPDLVVPSWLGDIPSAWLIIPLLSGSELIGFVVLITPRAAVEVNWEVLDLLKTASRQAASYLGQMRATEALLEARKFDAFNRMSAFVVHDLKNLVAQLSLMLRNAERHRGNPDFQRDMLTTVEHVVGRMNHLMLQLRLDAAPLEKPRNADIEKLVRGVCATKTRSGAKIAVDLAPDLYAVAHDDRLEHVLGHLIQNALDATAQGGTVSVQLRGIDRFAAIDIVDTGIGMSPEFVRERLFKPFETTKATGMGIGVYESSQYVTGLGGRILIDSTPNAGTRVRVLLPLGDDAPTPAVERGLA